MIRHTAAAVLLPLFGLLIGCSENRPAPDKVTSPKSQTTGASASPAKSKGLIAYSALTLTNPFFKTIADAMKAEAEKNGFEFVVVSGENDVKKQADQLHEFIVRGVAAIVLNPCDTQAIGAAIKQANDAGIPVFTNDSKYEGTEGKVISHVATDNYQGGKLAGEAMVKLLGTSGGNVGILHYMKTESCQMRVKGFHEVIDAHNATAGAPKIEIAMTLDGGGSRDLGFKGAKDMIEAHPDLAAIFAINDPSALGARSALESVAKADQVSIIAFDGQRIGKEAIRDGKLLCEPVQFPTQIGQVTVEQIIKHFNGEPTEPDILIPSKLYYKEDAANDPELKE